MKRRATSASTGGDKGVSQKAVKQALEIKRAGPYLIGKYLLILLDNQYLRGNSYWSVSSVCTVTDITNQFNKAVS